MIPEKPIAIPTADHSFTLYLPHLDEHYHSVKGALSESLHVYIHTAFRAVDKPETEVFECGFGTGLNAFLTLLECEKSGRRVLYRVVEAYPLAAETAESLGYPQAAAPGNAEAERLFSLLHRCDWDRPVAITPRFTLHKISGDFTTCRIAENSCDIIYYDAFAPDKQPEMWSEELLGRVARALRPGGVLSTYCAKGEIRRRLARAGLTVERTAGPPGGKREILKALRPESSV